MSKFQILTHLIEDATERKNALEADDDFCEKRKEWESHLSASITEAFGKDDEVTLWASNRSLAAALNSIDDAEGQLEFSKQELEKDIEQLKHYAAEEKKKGHETIKRL
jgi:hypothetical protein